MSAITITLNGRRLETAPDQTVLQAALANGIHIPHYCWHPALSIAGNCRMCLVEVEGVPKLQTACSTACRDGMVVSSENDRVRNAVRHVLEFLLLNHPIDCPVCDQAGECWLQIYYMTVGRYESRLTEDKVVKTKKATPLGPWVILDQERCILCSRCVRFTREITRTEELGIFQRGDHAEIDLFPGRTLGNPYSANVVDICPVGALTCRDFRFKCRVWYLQAGLSICPGCSRGCNIEVHHNPHRSHKKGGARVMRLKPRPNPQVNGYWMCDAGRYAYPALDENRLRHASVAGSDPDRRRALPRSEAVGLLADLIRQAEPGRSLVLLSAQSTNEGLAAARLLLRDALGFRCLLPDTGMHGEADDFLVRPDKHPNTRGVQAIFGLGDGDLFAMDRLPGFVKANGIQLLVVNRHEVETECLERLEGLDCRVVCLGTHHNRATASAHLTFPLADWAEQVGTFTNFEGRVQKLTAVLDPVGEAVPEWVLLDDLAQRLGTGLELGDPAVLFAWLAESVGLFRDMDFQAIGPYGEVAGHE